MKIEVKNLYHIYLKDTPMETLALENINLKVEKNEIIGIIGKSGSGKSTLIQHFNGLLKPTKGDIYINGKPISSKKNMDVTSKIGLVFQFPEMQLFEDSVYDDIAFGPRNLKWSKKEIDEAVNWAVDEIAPHLKDRFEDSPFKLSGGEQRKTAICGILAMKPRMICFDEPTAGMDPASKKDFFSLMSKLKKDGIQIIFISHNINDILNYSDRILIMENGLIAKDMRKGVLKEKIEILNKYGLDLPDVYKFSKYLSRYLDISPIHEEEKLNKILDRYLSNS